MKRSMRSVLMLALAWASPVAGISFPLPVPMHLTRVGAGADCDTSDLQAAIDAAAARAGQDRIEIAEDQSYTAVALVIDDDELLELVGGFEHCGDVDGAGRTVLSGAGGAPESVVTHVGGGPLVLRRLQIRDGDAQAGAGGISSTGVSTHHGASRLSLHDIAFEDNVGTLAGGLYVVGVAGPTRKRVEFFGEVRFARNRGREGGAISAIDSVLVPELLPSLTVVDNVAMQGDGGGLYLTNSAIRAGFACPIRFLRNTASRHGGGVSLQARAGSVAVDFFSRRPCAHEFVENYAGATGGAFHVWADGSAAAPFSSSANASLRVQDSKIIDNYAIDGAAIMLRSSAEGLRSAEAKVVIEARVPPPNVDAVACDAAPRAPCSQIRSNVASFPFGGVPPPPEGAALTVISEGGAAGDAVLEIRHSAVTDNSGRHVLRLEGPNASAQVDDALLADNDAWDGMVDASGLASVAIARSTLLHAVSWNGAALRADSDFVLERSIALFPGQQPLALRHANNEAVLLDVLLDDDPYPIVGHRPDLEANLAGGEPSFVDAPQGDYRLRGDSIAIDFWQPMPDEVVDRDLDLAPRGIDMPGVGIAPETMFDLGAYEYHHGVFDDGFE